MKLNEVKYEEMCELIDFIEENFKDDSDKLSKTLIVLRKFIPDLKGIGLIMLMNFLSNRDIETFNAIMENYGDLSFDKDGKSNPDAAEGAYDPISLDMLDMMTTAPLREDVKVSINRRQREILAAKDLKPLKTIKPKKKYSELKRRFVMGNLKNINVNSMENDLKSMDLDYEKILSKVFTYISDRSESNAKVFIEHFSIRLNSCALDVMRDDIRNIEFFNCLKSIV